MAEQTAVPATSAAAVSAASAANDKAVSDAKAATTGAQAVVDAVKRVADAAVAEISKQKVTGPSFDFDASGNPGGRFTLDGPHGGFGASGTVLFNGQQLETVEWSTQRIVGRLPSGAKSGPIEVRIDSDTVRHGFLKVA